jgi:hypothetical protein
MVLPRELAIRRLALIIIRINRDAKRRCRVFAAEGLLTSSTESGHCAERFKKNSRLFRRSIRALRSFTYEYERCNDAGALERD